MISNGLHSIETPQGRREMTHELKCWPAYFEAILDGRKAFEIRKDDRPFAVGDVLHLREWEPRDAKSEGWYTGRECTVTVTYMISGGPFRVPGHVIMSIRDCCVVKGVA